VAVKDVTAPQAACSLDRVPVTSDEDEDENRDGYIDDRYMVHFSAADNCDPMPCCSARLNDLAIGDGVTVTLTPSPAWSYSVSAAGDADEDGEPDGPPSLRFYGPTFTLEASCSDFSGNESAPCRSVITGIDEDEDGD
jgi:hypothetical protein